MTSGLVRLPSIHQRLAVQHLPKIETWSILNHSTQLTSESCSLDYRERDGWTGASRLSLVMQKDLEPKIM
jgi:hypothetical protein